jgi:hypothetical protein
MTHSSGVGQVPENEFWLEESWGLELGNYANILKQRSDFLFHMPQRETNLLRLGKS